MPDNPLSIGDSVLFICMLLPCIYLFVLAWAPMRKESYRYPKSIQEHRFAILLPCGTTLSEQKYPETLYDIYFYHSLPETVQTLDETKYHMAIILDKGSSASHTLLSSINNAYSAGITAIQLHHTIAPIATRKLKRQAIHEGITQSLFSQGCVQMGLSSAFSGTDVALEIKWLRRNMKSKQSNLEERLLQQNIFIEYLSYASVCSPTGRIPSHFITIRKALTTLPQAILYGQWSYVNRLIQCFIPSWKGLLIITTSLAVVTTSYNPLASAKWWMLLLALLFTLSMAFPDELVRDKKRRRNLKFLKT